VHAGEVSLCLLDYLKVYQLHSTISAVLELQVAALRGGKLAPLALCLLFHTRFAIWTQPSL
jgi:hypothetical protein